VHLVDAYGYNVMLLILVLSLILAISKEHAADNFVQLQETHHISQVCVLHTVKVLLQPLHFIFLDQHTAYTVSFDMAPSKKSQKYRSSKLGHNPLLIIVLPNTLSKHQA